MNTFVQLYDIASEALNNFKKIHYIVYNRCERPCFNRYRPKHFC